MALTCPNGHVNDEGNRFCEQCGAPLQQPQPDVAQPVAQATTSAGTTSSTCPVCGQENVPGTAFCDNCGAALPPPMPISEAPAPSAPADTAQTSAHSTTPGGSTITCSNCGTENDPANRFCDNCGARLSSDAAAPPDAGQPATAPPAPDVQAIDMPAVAPEQSVAPAEETAPPAPTEEAAPAAPAAIDPTLTAPEAPPAATTTDTSADRQRLEEEIRTQQQVVSQLEQMQASFGAATPAAVVQGLEEARQKLTQAEADLQSLTGGAPTAAQPAAPAPAPEAAPAQPAPESQPAPTQPAQPAQPAAPAIPSQPASSAAPAVVPATGGTNQLPPAPAQAQVSGPRFVSRDGIVLSLPRTGGEIVIGRDDPISGIHPDVDLTPHGGEAGGVSRRHAVLRESNGQWLLTDLDSTNYTRIDGNRITPDTPTPLHDGARVQFGRLEFDFHAS